MTQAVEATRMLEAEDVEGLESIQIRTFDEARITACEIGMDYFRLVRLVVETEATLRMLKLGQSIEGRIRPTDAKPRINYLLIRLRAELENLELSFLVLQELPARWGAYRDRADQVALWQRVDDNMSALVPMIEHVHRSIDGSGFLVIGALNMLRFSQDAAARVETAIAETHVTA